MSKSTSASKWRNFPAALGASSIVGGFVGAIGVTLLLLLLSRGKSPSIGPDVLLAQVRSFAFIFFFAASISFLATLVFGPPLWALFGRGKLATPQFFGAVGFVVGYMLILSLVAASRDFVMPLFSAASRGSPVALYSHTACGR